jgi:hypothetical protein
MFYASVVVLAFASIAATCQAWTSAPPQRKGATIRIPVNVIRIAIDDSEKPFHLSNLDQRFTADALVRFIDRYVKGLPKKGELPCVLIESSTKRLVEGEDQLNQHLQQLATDNLLTLIYMPPPIGDDPNVDLREFSRTFQP